MPLFLDHACNKFDVFSIISISFDVQIMTDISASDKELIVKLRALIEKDLQLVPSYSDDYSLLRWIIGWDRKMGGGLISMR